MCQSATDYWKRCPLILLNVWSQINIFNVYVQLIAYDLCLQVMSERYLVLFSFHLLILALDSSNNDFIYEVRL